MRSWKDVAIALIDKPHGVIALVVLAMAGPQLINATSLDMSEAVNIGEGAVAALAIRWLAGTIKKQ